MRYAVLLLLVLVAGGCSRTGLVYDKADWLAYRWAVRLVDAGSEQREIWRSAFRETLDLHRAELLPGVVRWLERVEQAAAAGLERQGLECLLEQAGALYQAHARLLLPLAVEVLSDLSPAQAGHLAARLAERNAEYRADYLDPDLQRRQAARLARHLERIERWTGRLTETQVGLVERHMLQLPDPAPDWLAYREQQQARMLELVRTRAVGLDAFLADWWLELDGRPAALAARHAQARESIIDLALALDADFSPAQRRTFIDRVGRLRADLQGLIETPDLHLTRFGEWPACS